MIDVAPPDLPAELLAAPTLGAWARQHGLQIPTQQATVLLATEIAELAWRRAVLERLDGISRFTYAGATTEAVITRIADLLDDIAPWIAEHLTAAP